MTTPIRLLNPRVGDHMVLLGSLTTNDDVKSEEHTDTDGVLVRKASDSFITGGDIPVCHG